LVLNLRRGGVQGVRNATQWPPSSKKIAHKKSNHTGTIGKKGGGETISPSDLPIISLPAGETEKSIAAFSRAAGSLPRSPQESTEDYGYIERRSTPRAVLYTLQVSGYHLPFRKRVHKMPGVGKERSQSVTGKAAMYLVSEKTRPAVHPPWIRIRAH